MEKIKFFREVAGLSQRDLARQLNVSQSAVAQWELGQTDPTLANLMQIAAALHVTINDLVE